MKKLRIEDIERLHEQGQAQRRAIAKEIDDLIRQESTLKDEASEAAANGNVDKYIEKAAEKDRVTATIYVKRTQLDKLRPFTDEDVISAWSNYLETYNRNFELQLAEYRKACESLRQKYIDLCQMQNAALTEKERYAAFSSTSLDIVQMATIPYENKRDMRPNLSFALTPDMRFCRSGCKTDKEEFEVCELFNVVVRQLKPYKA